MAMIISDLPNGTSNGSGFIVRKDGLIATNRHVIEGAQRIHVTLLDENKDGQLVALGPFPAVLVKASNKYDIALLRIKVPDRELTPCKLANKAPDRGSDVVVIGSPSLGKNILAGSVAKGQLNNIVVSNSVELLQTNATINPGNSGCPMFNMFGEVIGIITLKFDNPAERLSNVGFAIHIKHLVEEMNDVQ
jgi:serine protease Do